MQLSFIKELGFYVYKINVSAQKINVNRVKTFEMIIAFILIDNKNKKLHFFKKTFILADISIDITFSILFFILANVKINFNN